MWQFGNMIGYCEIIQKNYVILVAEHIIDWLFISIAFSLVVLLFDKKQECLTKGKQKCLRLLYRKMASK